MKHFCTQKHILNSDLVLFQFFQLPSKLNNDVGTYLLSSKV